MTDVIDKPTTSPISTQRHGDILIVTSNNPPVNALGAAVRQGLVAAIDEATNDDAIKAVVELQARWKDGAQVVALARQEEQVLWQRFRGTCDALFARRDAQRNARARPSTWPG